MGIGIIITSILGLIFFMGYQPQLSDAEIMERAKKLGMVDQFTKGSDIQRNPDGSLTITITEDETYSDVSQKLQDAGLIQSSIEFEIMLKKQNLLDAIKPGQYRISYQDDLKTIIALITGE
jgi:cell division protein YceG involved in septum cleavage